MTPSSFRDRVRAAAAAALALAAPAVVCAQDAPRSGLTVSTASTYDTVESGSGESRVRRLDSPGRLHLEGFRSVVRRHSAIRFWTGVTTGMPDGRQTHAEAFALDGSKTLSRRTYADFSARFSATPLDLFSTLGSAGASTVPVTNSSSAFTDARMNSYDVRASLSRTMGPHTTLDLLVSRTASSARGRGAARDDRVGWLLRRRIGPFSALRLGYAFDLARTGSRGDAATGRRHDIDVGLDYARPLTFARHTQVAVATGASVLTSSGGQHVRVSVNSALSRDISRLWSARLEYSRPIEYLAGFTQPFLSDAIVAGADGRLGRRATLTLSAGYSRGSVGMERLRPEFTSRSASGRLGVPLGRAWLIEFEAHDSRYALTGGGAPLPTYIPGQFLRRGARIGLVWTLPTSIRH